MDTGFPSRDRPLSEIIPEIREGAHQSVGQWVKWEPRGQDFRFAWRVQPDGVEKLAVRRYSGQPIGQAIVTRLYAQIPENLRVLSRRMVEGHMVFTMREAEEADDGNVDATLAGEAGVAERAERSGEADEEEGH